jgi:hypothetical protein
VVTLVDGSTHSALFRFEKASKPKPSKGNDEKHGDKSKHDDRDEHDNKGKSLKGRQLK